VEQTQEHGAVPPTPAPAGAPAAPRHGEGGLTHGAAVVASREELLDVCRRFLDEGLRAGDLTVVAAEPDTSAEILRSLGERAAAVQVAPGISLTDVRAPDALGAVRRLAEEAVTTGSGRLRILAEPHLDPTPQGLREHDRYEAASNAVLAHLPITALCAYDRSAVPGDVLRSVPPTHPYLFIGDGYRPCPAFEDPRRYLHRLPIPREPVEALPPVLVVDAAPRLPDLRHAVKAVLDRHITDEVERADLYLAVSEIAANAFRHGGRPVSARIWTDGRRMVCTVTDGGSSFDDPLAGFVPAHGDDLSRGGMGLWLARKLWDSVDLVRGPQGFTVRLATALR
jgi:anti-sigma regulatory factor (Ser/Thr protein kinase)